MGFSVAATTKPSQEDLTNTTNTDCPSEAVQTVGGGSEGPSLSGHRYTAYPIISSVASSNSRSSFRKSNQRLVAASTNNASWLGTILSAPATIARAARSCFTGVPSASIESSSTPTRTASTAPGSLWHSEWENAQNDLNERFEEAHMTERIKFESVKEAGRLRSEQKLEQSVLDELKASRISDNRALGSIWEGHVYMQHARKAGLSVAHAKEVATVAGASDASMQTWKPLSRESVLGIANSSLPSVSHDVTLIPESFAWTMFKSRYEEEKKLNPNRPLSEFIWGLTYQDEADAEDLARVRTHAKALSRAATDDREAEDTSLDVQV